MPCSEVLIAIGMSKLFTNVMLSKI